MPDFSVKPRSFFINHANLTELAMIELRFGPHAAGTFKYRDGLPF